MVKKADPEPSEKQIELLKFIILFVEENGFQPTQGEMAEKLRVTKNAIQGRLKELARRGLIEMATGAKAKERAITLKYVKFKAIYAERSNDGG